MIRYEKVNKRYGNVVALKDLSLHIKQGEFVFIIGESGAGKSSMIKLLMKEINPDSGSIYLNGENITKVSRRMVPKIRQAVGMIFQDFRLLEDMTVYGNIEYALDIIGASKKDKKKRIEEVLKSVNLLDRKKAYPNELSGGEQQRVSIARALSTKPNIIIADEPTGNLDPITSQTIVDNLLEINKEGITVVMITHEREIVDRAHKRVIHIADGQLVSDVKDGKYDV